MDGAGGGQGQTVEVSGVDSGRRGSFTVIGVLLPVVVPSPSWPRALPPQARWCRWR